MSRRPVDAAKLACPWLFVTFIEDYLGIPDPTHRLAMQLWRCLRPSPLLLYRMSEVHTKQARSDTIAAMAREMPPTQLMEAAERLVEEVGRTKQLIDVEESICQHIQPPKPGRTPYYCFGYRVDWCFHDPDGVGHDEAGWI